MVSRFRVMRLHCRIPLNEVAKAANISTQRLSQIETRYYGCRPQNPERLIKAFETVIARRKKDVERIEYIFENERETVFNYVEGGDGP
ncbi:MAG: helix-turn-helix transcriptional regulator [Clostridiales bacterium]|jgi:DNA-binding XRE family transcriptional regulator|nr:helix-turn-helix transcriptional regulator [Clostridiales bacterium]